MKKAYMMIVIMLAVFLAFQGTGFAKTVSGKLEGVDSAAQTLSIAQTNPATGASEKVQIWVSADTTYSGVAALGELKAGDEVWIDAEQDAASGNWKAKSVKVGAAPKAA